MHILNAQQEMLLKDERQVLNDLQMALVQFEFEPQDQETLNLSIRQLDELFLLVVVGEFNSGKSTFINALLGHKLLEEGVTPTTTQINILHYGETAERTVTGEHQHLLTFPADFLREISIVDTPGTNAIIREHEAITSQFVPRSDMVLFITSADRPFTESERVFLQRIRDWGKKVVLVINKIDILQNEQELTQVKDFVAENAHTLLGITPELFMISTRAALRAKEGEPTLWEKSGFEPLETYIHNTLDEQARIKLKFLNPLGVGEHLSNKYLAVVEERLGLLKVDFDTLNDVEAQLVVYKEDMQRDLGFRLADIENLLFDMEQRGQDFFDDTFRLARVMDLLSKERLQREFEQQIVADVPQRIERKVSELIDWLVGADLRQWQAVTEYLAERRREYKSRIVGDPGANSFHYDRNRLMDTISREAQHVVEGYDQSREASKMAEGAQLAVAASAAVEIGAVGLGALLTMVITGGIAVDVTGILLASVVAALGFFIIPSRRRQAKADMHRKIAALREQLISSLRQQFAQEIAHSLQHINESIAPYTRFVRAERNKLMDIQDKLQRIARKANQLKARIAKLCQE